MDRPPPIKILTAEDTRLSDYRDIKEADRLQREGLFLIEGAKVLRVAVEKSRFPLRSLLFSSKRIGAMADVIARCPADVPVYVAEPEVLSKVVGFDFHRGCIGSGARTSPAAGAEVVDALGEGPRMLLVLEALTEHDNVGSAFRNAAALGADAVLLDERCADPLYRKAIRVSIGTSLALPFGRVASGRAAAALSKARGFSTYALTPRRDAMPLEDLMAPAERIPERVALFVGTEGAGLDEATIAACDRALAIPMAAGVDSINVATAAAIAMFVFGRASKFRHHPPHRATPV